MTPNGLASRCPACQTVFRVVPDQLRVSGGWVRCGRCSEIFNAAESLVDVETGLPRRAQDVLPSGPETAPPGDEARARPEAFAPDTPDSPDGFGASEPTFEGPEPPLSPPASSSASFALEITDEPGRQAPTFDLPGSAQALADGTDARPAEEGTELQLAADAADAPAGPVPAFMRQAERAQRWRRPRVRAALGGLAVLGLLALAAQALLQYRDLAAARFPATRPALELACSALGCSVGPARAINSLAVESSGLVRVEKSSIYKLQVSLRNRAGIDVALPSLDLSLTDVQGRLIARKVLHAAELGAQQATLAAGRELALQATLQAKAEEPIAGYTIELFYP